MTVRSLSGLLSVAVLLAACGGAPTPSQPPDRPPPPAVQRPAQPAPPAQRAGTPSNPLAQTINAYRARYGLARIPVSKQLNRVAAAHAADLEAHYRKNARCNMHSWSSNGKWSPCCYTDDHAKKECMWNKPRELSAGAYTASGYEIVAWYSNPITPEQALDTWVHSPHHHAMIRNLDNWSDNPWRAMGAAQSEHYAVVWFGEEADNSR